MTTIEISLLVIGAVCMLGSFFVSEKLSSSDLGKIVKLSEDELRKIMEQEIARAGVGMDEVVSKKVEEASALAERAMEKEANEQVMHIHEYSETVLESMKKTHDEVMFLYSMLNDKHAEMASMANDLRRMAADVRDMHENYEKPKVHARQPVQKSKKRYQVKNTEIKETPVQETVHEPKTVQEANFIQWREKQDFVSTKEPSARLSKESRANDEILNLYEQGFDKVEIAKKLNRGLGEVNLVIGLYKGDENL